MSKRSWFFQNGFFSTLLALVLLVHLIFLIINFKHGLELSERDRDALDNTPTPKKEFKVKMTRARPKVEMRKQIVQSEDPSSEKRPVNRAYLGDKNRSFERETRARVIDKFKTSSQGESSTPKGQTSFKLSDLGAYSDNHHPFQEAAKEYQKKKLGTKEGRELNATVSSTNDFVEEVPLGDLTHLNTVEYQYYGFFFRIRQKIEQFWGRSIREKAASLSTEGRNIAQDENLITSLVVTLNEIGEIISISIKGASGIKELDDAAVQSFNQAGPFPNPPKGLIVKGKVRIEFGFVVKT